jgi:DNA modification methylase
MSHILSANSTSPFPLKDKSVQCCVTSPPYYGLRDYRVDGQIGHESLHDCLSWANGGSLCGSCYICTMRGVCAEIWRVLRDDGTFWLNIGDSYVGGGAHGGSPNSHKQNSNVGSVSAYVRLKNTVLREKNLMGVPWRVALALQSDGWYLRSDIVWNKTNSMVESVRDRCTKAHEYLFMLTKCPTYYFDYEASREPSRTPVGGQNALVGGQKYRQEGLQDLAGISAHRGGESVSDGFRNRRTVWHIAVANYEGSHYATFPEKLVEPCVLIGSRPGDVVLDPFSGSGTTGLVCVRNNRRYIGLELSDEFAAMSLKRLREPIQVRLI